MSKGIGSIVFKIYFLSSSILVKCLVNCVVFKREIGIISGIKACWTQKRRTVCADLLVMVRWDQHDLHPCFKGFLTDIVSLTRRLITGKKRAMKNEMSGNGMASLNAK